MVVTPTNNTATIIIVDVDDVRPQHHPPNHHSNDASTVEAGAASKKQQPQQQGMTNPSLDLNISRRGGTTANLVGKQDTTTTTTASSSSTNSGSPTMITSKTQKQAVMTHHNNNNIPSSMDEARERVAMFLSNSNRLGHHIHDYPTFDARELLFGRWLGKGGFSNVEELRGFLEFPPNNNNNNTSMVAKNSKNCTTQKQQSPVVVDSNKNGNAPDYFLNDPTSTEHLHRNGNGNGSAPSTPVSGQSKIGKQQPMPHELGYEPHGPKQELTDNGEVAVDDNATILQNNESSSPKSCATPCVESDEQEQQQQQLQQQQQSENGDCYEYLHRNDDNNIQNSDDQEELCRQFLIKNCVRNSGESRYAIKRLRKEIVADPKQLPSGAMDLAVEALFLADLQHPNIIKLRGISTADPFLPSSHSHDTSSSLGGMKHSTTGSSIDSGNYYFLVLDRLYETLTDRMKKWKERKRKMATLVGRILSDPRGRKRQALLDERLAAAFDLSAAMAYLKAQKIIHRDLKPENLGFDIRGDIKIFDFGLARELRDSDRVAGSNKDVMYHLSSMTGSLRYMAPEVATQGMPYNEKCDVYSFTIVLWEMLSLQRAYMDVGATQARFMHKVFVEKKRPPIKHSLSRNLKDLLSKGWAHDPRERLEAEQCQDILRNELVRMRHGDDTDLDHVRRRSTYLMDEEARHASQNDGKPQQTWTFHRRAASTTELLAESSQPIKLAWAAKPRSVSMDV